MSISLPLLPPIADTGAPSARNALWPSSSIGRTRPFGACLAIVEAIRENQRAPALIHAQEGLPGLDAALARAARPLCDGLMGWYRATVENCATCRTRRRAARIVTCAAKSAISGQCESNRLRPRSQCMSTGRSAFPNAPIAISTATSAMAQSTKRATCAPSRLRSRQPRRAQQGDRVRRIGVLMPGDENDPVVKSRVSAFTQALAQLGWTDGRNVRG